MHTGKITGLDLGQNLNLGLGPRESYLFCLRHGDNDTYDIELKSTCNEINCEITLSHRVLGSKCIVSFYMLFSMDTYLK